MGVYGDNSRPNTGQSTLDKSVQICHKGLVMAYPPKIKNKALELYRDGVSAYAIAKELKTTFRTLDVPTDKTIRRWIEEEQNALSDNWIEIYKANNGAYPPLPDYLAKTVNGYTPGQPVSKNLEIPPPSGQWLSQHPNEINQWRQLVEWLGKNPDDLLTQMHQMLPTSEPKTPGRWLPTHRL